MVYYYRTSPCHRQRGYFIRRPPCFCTNALFSADTNMQFSSELQGANTAKQPTENLVYRGRNFQLTEKEPSYEFQLHLPGVKCKDLTIEVLEGNFLCIRTESSNHRKIDQKYAFDETAIDATGIRANLLNGVLAVTLPKKEEKEKPAGPTNIPVSSGYSSGGGNCSKKSLLVVELPGVTAGQVEISYHNQRLHLYAQRLRGGEVVSTTRRTIFINTKKIDVSELEGFLADGVLEVVAPEKETFEPIKIPISTTGAFESRGQDENGYGKSAAFTLEEECVHVHPETVSQEEAAEDEEIASSLDGLVKSF